MEAIYYIWGTEPYLVERQVQDIIAKRQNETNGETEVIYLDTDEMRVQEWAEMLQFSPLFLLSRIVIMKRPPWLNSGNKKVRDAQIVQQVLEEYVNNPPLGQILLITSTGKPAGNTVVKLLEKKAALLECKPLTGQQLENWLREELKLRGCQAESTVLRKLVGSGQDMYYLLQVVEKLSLLGKQIGERDLDNQVEYKQEVKIFKLLDGVFERKMAVALEALEQLLQQGEAHAYILYMLSKQFTLYAQVKALQEEGYRAEEIEKITRQKPFTIKKMAARSRQYSWKEIETLLPALLQADIDLKSSGKDVTLLLESLLLKFFMASEIK